MDTAVNHDQIQQQTTAPGLRHFSPTTFLEPPEFALVSRSCGSLIIF